MFIGARLGLSMLGLLVPIASVSAQQSSPTSQTDSGKIYLDVVVTRKSEPPVPGLQQQDFVLLDNKVRRTITSFQALGGNQAPLEVILVVDAVNTKFGNVAFERGRIKEFLLANGGDLAHPTALAFSTDAGMEFQEGFSVDGKALCASLDQYITGLRSIRRSSAFEGAVERFQLSLDALSQLAARETKRPGRKLILWISPGWPLLSGPGIELGPELRQEIFAEIVSLSTQLLQARITLYSIDPLGIRDFGTPRTLSYQWYLRGISKASQVDEGDLALQVIAIQSGGLVLAIGNDIVAFLQKCLADTDAYYQISFDPPLNDKRDEYHHLEIKLTNSALTARTRQGYYANPDLKKLQFRLLPKS